jgi:protein-disulfide isomerase
MTRMRSWRRLTIAVSLVLFVAMPSVAQTTAANDDLQKQINALTEGQKAILKELQEVKQLLLARPSAAAAETLPAAVSISNSQSKGSATAKIAIIEYSDYQCPFCGRYDLDTFPQLETEYVKTGKVRYVFHDMPLDFHKNAFKAAQAARCAGEQGKFWEMHHQLFANQTALEEKDLRTHAAALNLDEPRFEQCLGADRYAADIRDDVTEANNAGLTGTPSFLLGFVQPDATVKVAKKIVGAKSYADFKAAIDSLLASSPSQTQ